MIPYSQGILPNQQRLCPHSPPGLWERGEAGGGGRGASFPPLPGPRPIGPPDWQQIWRRSEPRRCS
jgi:hypothetical protein